MANNDKYSDYWDWYDNGPGSESYKRELLGFRIKKFPNLPGFPFYKKETQRDHLMLVGTGTITDQLEEVLNEQFSLLQEKEHLPEELFEI